MDHAVVQEVSNVSTEQLLILRRRKLALVNYLIKHFYIIDTFLDHRYPGPRNECNMYCGFVMGHICCDYGNGTHRCESEKDCLSFREKMNKDPKDIKRKSYQSIVG